MNELQIFNYKGNEIRTVNYKDDTWWILKDVCDVLDLTNPSVVAERLDNDERAKLDLGRQGETNIVNESGLYSVILRSDKQEAKTFKRWITHEVLPSIRKTGSYQVPQEFNLNYARQCLESWEKAEKALTVANKTINKLAPLADFAQNVLSDHGSASMQLGQFAKCVNCGMGQNQLFEWMRKKGFLFKIAGMNLPMQEYLNRGYFTCVEKTFPVKQNGIVNHKTSVTTLITLKGQEWLVRKLREDGYTVNKELQIHLNLNITTNGVVSVQ